MLDYTILTAIVGKSNPKTAPFIDTLYIPNNETGIYLDMSDLYISSTDFNFFGCKNNDGDSARFMLNASNGKFCFGFNTFAVTNEIIVDRQVVEMNFGNDRKFKVDGANLAALPSSLPAMLHPIGIMGSIQYYDNQRNNGYDYAIYSVKISQGTNIVRDFVPAIRNADGKVGMLDVTGHNSSNGTPFFEPVRNTFDYIL